MWSCFDSCSGDGGNGPDCVAAGGTCQSSGTICLNQVNTTSCGDPSMWICCADHD
jgi:hypothetical protein